MLRRFALLDPTRRSLILAARRGDPAARAFSCCYLVGDELIALDAVNHVKDFMSARKLIAGRARFDLAKLADASVTLKEAVT